MMNALNNVRARVASPSKFEMTLLSGERKEEGGESPSQVQVEPKTYFANERTFIQWISAALLLLTVSSIMMGSGEYNGTSSVIAFSSLVLVFYASYVYFSRVQLLQSGKAYGYLDFIGPSILAVGVGLGVTIVFADAIKGSEFLPWGSNAKDYRRHLMRAPAIAFQENQVRHLEQLEKLQEVDGKCSLYSIEGINLLEYQPRDIMLMGSELIVATPQALVSHQLTNTAASTILSGLSDMDIQSITLIGDRLFALSVGPLRTELVELDESAEIVSTSLIQESASTNGSLVFVPCEHQGKLYINLDGSIHTYRLISNKSEESAVALSRTGTVNMKVLNHGGIVDDPITAMENFEGLTYMLRGERRVIETWDLNSATLVSEMSLPTISKFDKWVGMAFERRDDEGEAQSSFGSLRKRNMAATTNKPVYLHMALDTFPPQLWSFRLDEHDAEFDEDRHIFSFPDCDGLSMN